MAFPLLSLVESFVFAAKIMKLYMERKSVALVDHVASSLHFQ